MLFYFRTNFNKVGYEGEYKDGKANGQGNWMKEIIIISYFMYFDLFKKTGKLFFSNGDRYEGEWKDDNKNGQGKMFNSLGIIIE